MNCLTHLFSREARAIDIRQILDYTVLMASRSQIMLLLRNSKDLKIHSVSAGVLWCSVCDE